MDSAVDIDRLVFAYRPPRAILRISRLQIEKGERVFLYGPSGSGKTTLLGILAGVLKANDGSVRILGHDFARISGPARDALRGTHIGYVFQMFNLIPYLNVLENMMLPCRIRRMCSSSPPAGTRVFDFRDSSRVNFQKNLPIFRVLEGKTSSARPI